MTKNLADTVAVVTGGTSGIGLATARRFSVTGIELFVDGGMVQV